MVITRRGQKLAAKVNKAASSKKNAAKAAKTPKAAKTAKAAKAKKDVSHKEKQVAHLCPIHSFNHLLQEKKLVWVTSKPFLLTPALEPAPAGASPKDENVKLNLWAYCKDRALEHLKAQRNEYLNLDAQRIFEQLSAGEPSLESEYYRNPKYTNDFDRDLGFWRTNLALYGGLSVEDIVKELEAGYGGGETLQDLEAGGIGCTMKGPTRGDLPFAWFRMIFDLLGYEHIEVNDEDYVKILNKSIKEPTFLGMVINQGAWHYVALPRFVLKEDCPPNKFVIADSLNAGIYECYTKRQLNKALQLLPLTRAYLIFAKDAGAYQSVAVKRMTVAIGRKRKTRKQ